jgi:hypothetical protein
LVAIERDSEVLITGTINRSTDSLRRMVAGNDPDLFAVNVQDRFNLAGRVETEQIAFRTSRDRPFASGDAANRHFDEIDDVFWMADPDNSPLDTGFAWVPSPQNLRRTFGFGFEDETW